MNSLLKTFILGPDLDVAADAVGAVTRILGLSPNTPKDQLVNRLDNATDEEQEKLTKLEADVAIQTYKLANENTKNARDNYTKNRDHIATITASSVAIAFLASVASLVTFALMQVDIPGNLEVLLSTMIGHISGMMSNKVNFFWGASNTENKK